MYVNTGFNVTSFSTGNSIVNCDEFACLEPGPTSGLYCNPHIRIVDYDEAGDSYVNFNHDLDAEDLCADGDSLSNTTFCTIGIDKSYLDVESSRLIFDFASAYEGLSDDAEMFNMTVDEVEPARRLSQTLRELIGGRLVVTRLNGKSLRMAARSLQDCSVHLQDCVGKCGEEKLNYTKCMLSNDQVGIKNVARKTRLDRKVRLTKPDFTDALSVRGNANGELDRRQFATVASKAKELFGSYLDVVVERQKLSLREEGKTAFYYARECASNGLTTESTVIEGFNLDNFNLTAMLEGGEARRRRLSESGSGPMTITIPTHPPR